MGHKIPKSGLQLTQEIGRGRRIGKTTSHLINEWGNCLCEEARTMDLTDEQWQALEPLIGEMPRRADGRGRPCRSSREVLNGIFWILRTGVQWADLPDRYPPYQ